MQNKFFNVSFKLFPKYETCTDRVIHVEYENENTSEITLEGNAKEPTLKLENGTVLLKGPGAAVTLEGSPKSISTTQKFTGKKAEFEILVRKFVDPKQTCRALKSEAEKYSNVTYDSSMKGYRGTTADGKDAMCYVNEKCLVVYTTTSIKDSLLVPNKSANSWGIVKIIFGAALLIIALWAFTGLGMDFRILFILIIGAYYVIGGFQQLRESDDDCPKFNL